MDDALACDDPLNPDGTNHICRLVPNTGIGLTLVRASMAVMPAVCPSPMTSPTPAQVTAAVVMFRAMMMMFPAGFGVNRHATHRYD
jgi:hypothetical protein